MYLMMIISKIITHIVSFSCIDEYYMNCYNLLAELGSVP